MHDNLLMLRWYHEKNRVISGPLLRLHVTDVRDFLIVDVNAAFLSEMGLAREEVTGKDSRELMHRSPSALDLAQKSQM